jgi:hypothetical protein
MKGVDIPRRVISVAESLPLSVLLRNDDTRSCTAEATLKVAKFDVSPAETSQKVTLAPGAASTLVWVIAPKEPGNFTIVVSSGFEHRALGVSVRTVLGLSARLAGALTLLGLVVGPAITIPWWLDQWRKWRVNRSQHERSRPPWLRL